MRIFIDGEPLSNVIRSERVSKGKMTVAQLLDAIEMNRETVIVKCNGKILTEYDELDSKGRIDLIRVSSGG